MDNLRFLQLLQLADSALPTGALSHSFGLESLVEEGVVSVDGLEGFLSACLKEGGLLEAAFCRQAYHLAGEEFSLEWGQLNDRISAFKPARESRQGSLALGRRLVALALQLEDLPPLRQLSTENTHYCAVFGLLGRLLEVEEEAAVLAYLQQTTASLISAGQRLMALGQGQAARINWRLKPAMLQAALDSRETWPDNRALQSFTPLVELASMRHPVLRTRLFIS